MRIVAVPRCGRVVAEWGGARGRATGGGVAVCAVCAVRSTTDEMSHADIQTGRGRTESVN